MATIVKRGESWYCQVRKKGIAKRKTFSTYEDALNWSNVIEKEIDDNLYKQADIGILKYNKSEISTRELKRIFSRSQDRAKKYNMTHSLTLDNFFKLWEFSKGHCSITGLPFSNVKPEGCRRRPFYPSLDRIDPKEGYIIGNVRIVCIIANIARSDFDDGSLIYMAKGIVRTQVSYTYEKISELIHFKNNS